MTMDRNKRYLTQISQKDISEIADAANIHSGDGIVFSRDEKGIEVSIDKQALRTWVNALVQGREI